MQRRIHHALAQVDRLPGLLTDGADQFIAVHLATREHGFRIYNADVLIQMLNAAGFSSITIDHYHENAQRPDGTPYARKYLMVRALA